MFCPVEKKTTLNNPYNNQVMENNTLYLSMQLRIITKKNRIRTIRLEWISPSSYFDNDLGFTAQGKEGILRQTMDYSQTMFKLTGCTCN